MVRYMSNIALFDEYTASALAALYEAFPRRIYLDARKLCGHDDTDDFGLVLNTEGQPSRHFEVALATIQWLADSGYIRTRGTHVYGLPDAVLTAEGLQVLKSVPDSLKSSEPLGERLVGYVRSGAKALAAETAKAIIGAGVSAGITAT